jgi:hypothetical protein
VKTHTVKVYYCPKGCNRSFYDLKDNAVGLKLMEEHVERAHPEFWSMYKEL